MQKKILATAIGAMLVAPAIVAQADVTVYGQAQIEWAQVTNDSQYYSFGNAAAAPATVLKTSTGGLGSWNNNSVPADTTRSGVLDNKRGRFGIKADEDLGSGWKAFAHFEWQVDTADGADGATSVISDRVSTVGVSNKAIGNLRFGQDNGPYKDSGTAIDPFVTTALEARNNYGMSGNRDGWGVMNGHNSFLQDGMFFNSASFGGAYVNAYLGMDRTGSNSACSSGFSTDALAPGQIFTGSCDAAGATNAKNNGDLAAVVGWKGDVGVGLHVFGGYARMANTTSDEPTAMKLGAQVTVAKAHTITLQYEMTDRADDDISSLDEADYLFLGYAGKFGPVTAVAQYGQMTTGDLLGVLDYEGSYMAVGAIYNFSKTFRAHAGWRQTQLDENVIGISIPLRDDSVLSVGLRKDF